MLKIVDVSQYNTITDYTLLGQNVSAVLIKSSQGVVEDRTFRAKYAGATGDGIRTGIWHLYHPDMDAKSQIVKFLAIYNSLSPKPGWIGLDCEPSRYLDEDGNWIIINPPGITQYSLWVMQWLQAIELETRIIPRVYTCVGWWNQWVLPSKTVIGTTTLPNWSHYPLWVAYYSTRIAPWLPRDWAGWEFWQRGVTVTPGIATAVDTDWYNGDEVGLDTIFGTAATPTPVAPVAPVNDNEIATAVVNSYNGLRVRSGPDVSYAHLRSLSFGAFIQIYEEKNGWARISSNQEWVSMTYLTIKEIV